MEEPTLKPGDKVVANPDYTHPVSRIDKNQMIEQLGPEPWTVVAIRNNSKTLSLKGGKRVVGYDNVPGRFLAYKEPVAQTFEPGDWVGINPDWKKGDAQKDGELCSNKAKLEIDHGKAPWRFIQNTPPVNGIPCILLKSKIKDVSSTLVLYNHPNRLVKAEPVAQTFEPGDWVDINPNWDEDLRCSNKTKLEIDHGKAPWKFIEHILDANDTPCIRVKSKKCTKNLLVCNYPNRFIKVSASQTVKPGDWVKLNPNWKPNNKKLYFSLKEIEKQLGPGPWKCLDFNEVVLLRSNNSNSPFSFNSSPGRFIKTMPELTDGPKETITIQSMPVLLRYQEPADTIIEAYFLNEEVKQRVKEKAAAAGVSPNNFINSTLLTLFNKPDTLLSRLLKTIGLA